MAKPSLKADGYFDDFGTQFALRKNCCGPLFRKVQLLCNVQSRCLASVGIRQHSAEAIGRREPIRLIANETMVVSSWGDLRSQASRSTFRREDQIFG